jgi:hypothetical protein
VVACLSAELSGVENILFANLWRTALSMVTLIALIAWSILRLLDEGVPLTLRQCFGLADEKLRTGQVNWGTVYYTKQHKKTSTSMKSIRYFACGDTSK